MPVSAVTVLCTAPPPPAQRVDHFCCAKRRCGGLWRSCQGRAVEVCHSFAGAGNGGGAGRPKKGTGRFDKGDSNDNSSWRINIVVLVLTVSGYACWRHITKPYSWAAYHEYPGKVSLIIPALNEEKCIAATLRAVQSLNPLPYEILVVDGGSHDRTKSIAASMGVSVLSCDAGRARQMNFGAKVAKGDLLCFLHADTQPPNELVAVVRGVMANPNIVLGGFRTIIQTHGKTLQVMTLHHLIKTYYIAMFLRPVAFVRGIRCLFGDQTLFCRAADFKAVSGFQNDLPIMEDVDLCIRMHEAGTSVNTHESHHGHSRRGRISMVMNPVNETSGRRLSDWGALHATYVHFYIALRWYFGAKPEQMYKIYHDMYTDNHR
ncbi:hypothetical protein WJX77_003760 [Trebouxia sp. C0004]